jgi:eukaryotic-like serine/threonine-protein kinase
MSHRRLLADRYRLGELLGTGGAAVVRRARDVVLARDVAIKLAQPGAADVRRFDNEIRTLASLSHPGLVAVYDADTSSDTPFMVLELVEGHTLRDRIANGPMGVEEVRRLGAALAEALAYVHDHGFIHRDVKPSNVLLGEDDVPRLADFGLARLADGARLTRADQVVGTAAYLAPEQVRGAEITSAVDVYALGLVLLECLTGHREYEGAEIEAAVARLHRPPVIPDDLPFDVVRLLSLMTSLAPARRPSASECAAALLGAKPPTSVLPLLRRSRGVLVAASVAVLLAATGTGLVVQNRTTPAESAPPATTQPSVVQPAPVVQQPFVETTEPPPPVEAGRQGNSGKGKSGKGKGNGKP